MRSIEPGDPQWERFAATRARHEAMRAALVLPTWPVFGPAGPAENPQLAGYGQMDGETTSLDIVSGGPDPDLWVHSQVAGSEGHRSIDMVLADRFAETGREYPVPGQLADVSFGRALPASPHARPAVVRVDGVAHEARRQEVEEFTAWQLLVGDVVVTAVARNRVPADLELVRLLDLPPAPARPISEGHRPEWTRSGDWTKEPDQSRPLWAHRGVVAMALAQAEAHRSTDRQNRPSPPLDPDWGLWWDAARDEQIRRTGATRHDALDAVGAMVNQLSELQENATWWGAGVAATPGHRSRDLVHRDR